LYMANCAVNLIHHYMPISSGNIGARRRSGIDPR
jgi:hypothetical protein